MNNTASAKTPVERLRHIMTRLRNPESGCAWDIKQSFASIAPFTIEEAYEVVDAIEREDVDDLKDELGDLLFQVIYHSQMASELGLFDFDDVAQGIVEKMIRRHPHVFADVRYESEQELKLAWEAIKAQERQAKRERKALLGSISLSDGQAISERNQRADGAPEKASILDGIANNLTALKQADKLQKRAASVGFDWPDIDPVWSKLAEEIAEVQQACTEKDQSAITDEIGDLLFTVVNLARHLGVDSETALRQSSRKFEARFRKVEELAAAKKTSLAESDLQGLDDLWDKAKQLC